MIQVVTMAYIMSKIIESIKTKINCSKVVFDPSLSYETATSGVKIVNFANSITEGGRFPLLAHNRSVLKLSDKLNQRSRVIRSYDLSSELMSTPYYGVLGQIDARFLYISKNIYDIELFEVAYNADIIRLKSLEVDYKNFGKFNYEVYWNDLEDLSIMIDNQYYKSVSTSASIHGWFFIFDDSQEETLPLIEEIRQSVEAYYNY